MTVNEYGFEVPVIDKDKCINCGKCERNCPTINNKGLVTPQKVYAVWSREEQIRKDSASGGISMELAKATLANGGVVYGTTYSKENFVHVTRIDNIKDIKKIQGSRYVKSNMMDTVARIKEDVKERKVLFLGTPCQCSAIKNVIGDNENLTLVDLVCHGTPSQTYLKEELKWKGFSDQVDDLHFRKNGFKLLLFKDNKEIYSEKWGTNHYYHAFMKSLTYQENCYSCVYASKDRIGDISIGDFWGIDKEWQAKYAPKTGISLVMVNSDKGVNLINECSDAIEVHERTLEEAVKGNDQLQGPAKKHKNREKFLKDYAKHGYRFAMKKNLFEFITKKKIKYMFDKNAW